MKIPPLFKRQNLSYKNAVLPLFKRRTLIVNSLIFACKGRYYAKNSAYKIGSKNNKNSSYRSCMQPIPYYNRLLRKAGGKHIP